MPFNFNLNVNVCTFNKHSAVFWVSLDENMSELSLHASTSHCSMLMSTLRYLLLSYFFGATV